MELLLQEEGERMNEQIEAKALQERKRTAASPETVALVVKANENASVRSVIDSQKQLLGGVHMMLSDWMVRMRSTVGVTGLTSMRLYDSTSCRWPTTST